MNTYKVTIVRGKVATVITALATNSGQAKASAPVGVDGITEVFIELVNRAPQNKGRW